MTSDGRAGMDDYTVSIHRDGGRVEVYKVRARSWEKAAEVAEGYYQPYAVYTDPEERMRRSRNPLTRLWVWLVDATFWMDDLQFGVFLPAVTIIGILLAVSFGELAAHG